MAIFKWIRLIAMAVVAILSIAERDTPLKK